MKKVNITYIVLAVSIVIAAALGGFFFFKYQEALAQDPARETKQIVKNIREVIDLPDEEPSSATIKDATKITNSILAEQAKNDDKMLIFANAKKIVLYRPSTKKVIDILTIKASEATSQTEATGR